MAAYGGFFSILSNLTDGFFFFLFHSLLPRRLQRELREACSPFLRSEKAIRQFEFYGTGRQID